MDSKFDEHRPLGDAKHLGTDVHDAPTDFETKVGRATADPGALDNDQIRRAIDAQIALFRIDDLVWLVAGEDLEFVVFRHVRDSDHRIVDSVADIADAFARSGLADVDSDERHDGALMGSDDSNLGSTMGCFNRIMLIVSMIV
jgi:hypothetical protein